MSKLVSIVLPVYNGEKYLRESVDSILQQSYSNWELLIIDDCSSDSSASIAKAYAATDSRIHYYRNAENMKLPRTLNRGFSLAAGEYLTWTSDDNKYRSNALERMVHALDENPELGFVFASCRVINESGKEIEYISVTPDSPRWIVGSNSVGACFLYTRRVYEAVGEYNPDLVFVEDFDYWQRICMKFQAIGISEILYDYRWHKGALTSTMNQEVYNRNLETMLLKNRPGFGKLSPHQEYLYYKKLNSCREKTKENPYKWPYALAKTKNMVLYRMPKKAKSIAYSLFRQRAG